MNIWVSRWEALAPLPKPPADEPPLRAADAKQASAEIARALGMRLCPLFVTRLKEAAQAPVPKPPPGEPPAEVGVLLDSARNFKRALIPHASTASMPGGLQYTAQPSRSQLSVHSFFE